MSGLYEGTDLADKTFYGFRLDAQSGNLDFEIIRDGIPVVLPQDGVIDPADLKAWFWSANAVSMRWNKNGHLEMVML